MTSEIHIQLTIQLQPSPELLQLVRSWLPDRTVPQKKNSIEWKEDQSPGRPGDVGSNRSEPYLLVEIPKFDTTYLQFKNCPTHPTLRYCEDNERVCLSYLNTKLYTTWPDLHLLEGRFGDLPYTKTFGPLLRDRDKTNRRTMVIAFLRAISQGLKPGQPSQSDHNTSLGPLELFKLKPGQPGQPGTDQKKSGDVIQPEEVHDPDAAFRPFNVARSIYPPNNSSGDFGKGGLE